MSNKETLQNNNERLNVNNINIKSIINLVDNLPEGGTEIQDLTIELTAQDILITEQKDFILEAITKIQGKASGGGNVLPTVEGNTLVFSSGTVEGGVLKI